MFLLVGLLAACSSAAPELTTVAAERISQISEQSPPSSQDPPSQRAVGEEEIQVWVTPSGKRYHKSSCRYAKSGSSISLKEARSRGLSACKTCGGH